MTTRSFMLLALLGAAACGKGKADTVDPQPGAPTAQVGAQAARALGVSALPAETRVVLGAAVPRIAASPLARRLVAEILGRDPEAFGRLAALLERCRIDPARDVAGVTIAMAEPTDVAIVVRGKLDEAALVECVRAEATASGGTFADAPLAGRTVHAVVSKDGAQRVWFAALPDQTIVVALAQPWMAKILDPAAPKIDTKPEMLALVQQVGPEAALWGVGFLPPGVGQKLVELTKGEVGQPARSVAFEAGFDKGVTATLRLDLASDLDAGKLAGFLKSQLDWLAIAAQRMDLGQIVSKTQVVSVGPSVKLTLVLDDKDVKQLEAALTKVSPNPDKSKEPPK